MKPRERVVERLDQLIDQADSLRESDERGHVRSATQYQDCRAWITASQNILVHIFTDKTSPYVQHVEDAIKEGERLDWEYVAGTVGEIRAILRNLITDLEAGLLQSITDHARAETFDNFLDHARVYLENGQKNEAGVIAGVVFEDTVRRIASKFGIAESGNKLDSVISALATNGVISGAVAKRSRAAAHVRTKATHAQWDAFQAGDVEAAIAVTDELVLAKIDG